jgi:GNAT superfamily N-acetyltransferase
MPPSNQLTFSILSHGSPQYHQAVALREALLRRPLGKTFTPQELDWEKDHVQVAGLVDHKVVATAILEPQGQVFKMRRVAVQGDLQGLGLGSKLLDFCEQYARSQQVHAIWAYARVVVLGFYEKNGYPVVGQVFDYEGIPHVRVQKNLLPPLTPTV